MNMPYQQPMINYTPNYGAYQYNPKTNITDNEFATENEDYWGFDIDVEGNKAVDYKLTAHFAKKLSVKGNSEKAEQAREYFTTVEERVKQKAIDISQLSPELKMFNTIFQSVAQQQSKETLYRDKGNAQRSFYRGQRA